MFFLNLTAGEFLTLFAALGGFVAALYLLDRSKRKKIVSTLRFWTPALSAEEQQSRKRMREPWSLVLQLGGLLLLLLAIAQLQWGTRDRRGRDHVLLLDTSSWSGAHDRAGIVLDREKSRAAQFVNSLPRRDRVLLVRVDALASPVTAFTSDRAQISHGIAGSTPGFSALNIEQALSYAQQARSWSGGQPGEIVYVGPERVSETDITTPRVASLRVIPVSLTAENCGIRHLVVKRGDTDGGSWQATVALKNYGARSHTLRLRASFGATAFVPRTLTLTPEQEITTAYDFVTNGGGRFTAAIEPDDDLPADNRVSVELPKPGALKLAVYTDRPEVLRPLFAADHRLSVKVFSPANYVPKPAADIMLVDEFAPSRKPEIPSLWIAPPKNASPLPVKSVVTDAVIKSWQAESAVSAGLRAKDTRLPSAEVFETFEGDLPVANVDAGPVVVARTPHENSVQMAVIGFDPLTGPLRYEVTTPLLLADLLHWLAPEAFRNTEFSAGRVGTAVLSLDDSEKPDQIRVTNEDGFALPFTARNQILQLFADRPGIVRVVSGGREHVLSLTLPDVAEYQWHPPATVATGVPAANSWQPSARDLWEWLAVFAGLLLFAEWMLFGRARLMALRKFSRTSTANARSAESSRERELVSK